MHRVLDSKIFEIFYLELFTRKIQSSETRRPHYLALHRIFLFVLLFLQISSPSKIIKKVHKTTLLTRPNPKHIFLRD
jgi:hypothetical protein